MADLDRYVELLEKWKGVVSSAILQRVSSGPSTHMVHLGSLGKFISDSGLPHEFQGLEDEELPFCKVGSLSIVDGNAIIRDARNYISREVASQLTVVILLEE
ncbi:hypothetical protein [Corynebacterium sp. CCM 9203]|uniref:hypothetical protein n=1 Tax=Corynebacterium sp. CCM 9203 TaxID=3057615 RepID=UPI0035261B40